MPSHTIYYIRHGETPWNAEGRFQGGRDIPLNERGRAQAATAGGILRELIANATREPHHFGYFSSPLTRARTTMDLLRGALGMPADGYKLEHRLREISWGEWEGMTSLEMQAHDPVTYAARRKDRWGVTAPKGETYAEVAARVRTWLSELKSDTVAVAHGGTMRALMVATGVATTLEAMEAVVEQGVVYVFADGKLTKHG